MRFFFFSSRRRHTRLQGDWSSDVCSSDLSWSKPALFVREPWRLAESGLLLGLRLSVGLFVFVGLHPRGIVTGAMAYMTVPLLVWATFRFGQHGATVGLALVSTIAVWGTAHGHGPFVQRTLHESLLLLQIFVG